jgi:hypothetical protein
MSLPGKLNCFPYVLLPTGWRKPRVSRQFGYRKLRNMRRKTVEGSG